MDNLKGPGQHRHEDPITAKLAAKFDRTSQRGRVLEAIFDAEGIADELEDRTKIAYRSVTPRLGELKRLGMVETNGKTRISKAGSPQAVYSITPRGWFRVMSWRRA